MAINPRALVARIRTAFESSPVPYETPFDPLLRPGAMLRAEDFAPVEEGRWPLIYTCNLQTKHWNPQRTQADISLNDPTEGPEGVDIVKLSRVRGPRARLFADEGVYRVTVERIA